MTILPTLCPRQSTPLWPSVSNNRLQQRLSFYGTLLLVLMVQALSAQTWTGNTSTDWNTATNWTPMTVPTTADDVTIPNVANDPMIKNGTVAVAKSITVQSGAVLTIDDLSSLLINGFTTVAMLNQGTITNHGNLFIGQTSGTGDYGLHNLAIFDNTGEIRIDRTVYRALYNETGTFTNAAKIIIGAGWSVGTFGLQNDAAFYNNAGGDIRIDRSVAVGLENSGGSFSNAAKITIGSSTNIGQYGIVNHVIFDNNPGGEIFVDRSLLYGIINFSGTFTNAAKITIGATAPVGECGLLNDDTFNNLGAGELHIDRSSTTGLWNFTAATFVNTAKIIIGAVANVGAAGLKNENIFNNTGGEISIDRSASFGLVNLTGTFTNAAKLTIGALAPVGAYGIINETAFNNNAGGDIHIDRSTQIGLFHPTGTFINAAKIIIGGLAGVGQLGIKTEATFKNQAGGDIRIDRSTDTGLYNLSGTFTNAAQITIGATVSAGSNGLQNYGTFNNETGGDIHIDRSFYSLFNGNVFNNAAVITTGSIAFGQYGVSNEGTFENKPGGEINLDRCSFSCLLNTSGVFNNKAKIAIGANAGLAQYGIRNQSSFTNALTGSITIDRTDFAAIQNTSVTFTNSGELLIGAGAGVTGPGIINQATFYNTLCARLITLAPISNSNLFVNIGYFIVNTLGVHTNSALSNFGVIEYPQGNLIPNVINTDLIVAPLTGTCGSFTPALQIGNANNYLPPGQWYLDENLTVKAGDYDYNSNTFLPTNLPAGTHLVYFSVENNNNSFCPRVVSLAITAAGPAQQPMITATPNPVCKDNVFNLSVSGAVGTAYNWSGSGVVNVNAGTTTANSPVSGPQTYGVTVTDANGCKTTGTTQIVVSTPPVGTISGPADYCGAATTQLTFNATAGVGPFSLIINGVTYNNIADGGKVTVPIVSPGGTFNLTSISGAAGCTNTGSPLSTVTVACGNVPPAATPPADITVQCGNIPAPGTVLVASSCPTQVFYIGDTPTPGACNNNYLIKRTWEARDNCGHVTTCTQTITVVDNTAPTITCPSPKIVPAGANCSGVVGAYAALSVSDNCTPTNALVVTQSPSAATLLNGNKDSKTVTLSANDGCGNTGTCSFSVTLKDVTGPTLVCKNYTANLDAAGTASIVPANIYQSGSDNCGSVNLQTLSPTTFNCANVGQTQVVLTANDGNGNTASCTAIVTIKDGTPPVAKCKDATATLDASGTVALKAIALNNGSTDNCSFTLLLTPSTFNCTHVGVNTVTMQATDAGGNTSTCTAKVTIKDLSAPVALCKNPVIYLDDNGQATLTAAQVNNGSSDACGLATMSISQTQFNCSELQGSPWNITLNLTDTHGNSASCLASVTVKDKIVPTAICQDVTVKLGASGKVVVNPANLAADSYDNCSVWSYSPVAKTYTSANLGPNNLSITVKDWNGNAATCVSVVTVQPYSGLDKGSEDRAQNPPVFSEDLAFHLFPNPSVGTATVAFRLPVEQAFMLRVFDLSGRVVWSRESVGMAGDNSVPLQLTDLSAGIYVIDFQSENLKKQSRLVIEK